MKVFIQGLDTPFGHNLSFLLSNTPVGSRKEEQEDEHEEPKSPATPDKVAQKPVYEVVGTLKSLENTLNHQQIPKLIESGDKKKDGERKVAIEKVPIAGKAPKWVSNAVSCDDQNAIVDLWNESDVIIYDCLESLQEAQMAIEKIEPLIDSFKSPKMFILMSTVMTWAKTKPSEDEETAFTEDEYRKRKPHPNFKDHCMLEKLIVKLSKKDLFKGYVVCPGLVYHAGESIFHSLLKQSWHNAEFLKCYGDGSNILPCIHLDDLISIVAELVETQPEARYIVAVDDSKSTYYEIVKAIADQLSNGRVQKQNREDAFLDSAISQKDYDLLSLNLRIDPVWVKESGLELKYETGFIENLPAIIQEYRDCRGLWPVKVAIHGPPGSGKSFFAKKMAEHYAIHYIEPDELVHETIAEMENKLANASVLQAQQPEGEEIDFESIKSELNDLKEQVRINNGKLPAEQLIGLIRDKLRSMPCRNQGYVLDGYPTTNDEANDLLRPLDDDGGREDRTTPVVDEQISPEFVFTIEMSDSAIRHRFMKMPERASISGQLQAPKYTEDTLNKKLEEFRKANTDEVTVLNFFDELEILPFTLQVEILDNHSLMKQIVDHIGPIRNYGPSAEQIQQQLLKEEEQRRLHEKLVAEELARRETEEDARHKKIQAEWNARLEQVKKQEKDVLEVQSEPLRNYLLKYVMPTLTKGLIQVAKVRPDDPIDYLAEFLFQQNIENSTAASTAEMGDLSSESIQQN